MLCVAVGTVCAVRAGTTIAGVATDTTGSVGAGLGPGAADAAGPTSTTVATAGAVSTRLVTVGAVDAVAAATALATGTTVAGRGV
ncbi:hypothetical protein C5U48_10790 [Mycolicibacter virginiensis]|uniref:Uncharacterized protein n=1 Tax=Mycolicibacter virginiensis TaxID=1795032 RepID=A0A9X7IN77_9MYCO|nr:hypothetical protein C5U48_10790 [Mycolicibacter virginiensis]